VRVKVFFPLSSSVV